jgi:hypothetical protein
LTPEDFRCAFTTAQGWGTFSQKREAAAQHETIELKWGSLRLRTLAFALPNDVAPATVAVTFGEKPLDSSYVVEKGYVRITFAADAVLVPGQVMNVHIGAGK